MNKWEKLIESCLKKYPDLILVHSSVDMADSDWEMGKVDKEDYECQDQYAYFCVQSTIDMLMDEGVIK